MEQVTLDTALAVAAAGGRSLVVSAGGRLEPVLRACGAETIRAPMHSRNPLTLVANAVRLKRIIESRGVSLVHVRSRAPAFSALWAARAARVPVIATYHGVYQARSAPKRWYNAVMTRGDLVLANSIFTRDHILAEHGIDPARVVVATEGIDTARFDPLTVSAERVAAIRAAWDLEATDRRPVLLLAARLAGWKGQRLMIEAMTRLAGPATPVLILAGKAEKPEEAAALRVLADRAGLGERVRLVGAVNDMPAAYLAADLVVAPSVLPESFGRSVVEAAAAGRPVLASPLGGPGETIIDGETGWLVTAGDSAAWARAVDAALATPPTALARMGAAARARAMQRYSLEAMTATTFAIYRRLLEDRP